nr:MAG TPA: hypothetical protein [Caudoviricetes sp.]
MTAGQSQSFFHSHLIFNVYKIDAHFWASTFFNSIYCL